MCQALSAVCTSSWGWPHFTVEEWKWDRQVGASELPYSPTCPLNLYLSLVENGIAIASGRGYVQMGIWRVRLRRSLSSQKAHSSVK